jgi:hypothetical protein
VAVRLGAAGAQLSNRAVERAALDVGENDGETFLGEPTCESETNA